jgi:osmotically-inducible protein OsmY
MNRQMLTRAAFAVAAGISASTTFAHLPKHSAPDHALAERVAAVLAQDQKIRVLWPLDIAAYDGTVRITGRVASAPMIYRTVEKVRAIDGVRGVDVEQLDSR